MSEPRLLASQVIAELTKLVDEFGDLPVVVSGNTHASQVFLIEQDEHPFDRFIQIDAVRASPEAVNAPGTCL